MSRDPATVGLPREFLHFQLPFWGPLSAPKCLAEMGGRPGERQDGLGQGSMVSRAPDAATSDGPEPEPPSGRGGVRSAGVHNPPE